MKQIVPREKCVACGRLTEWSVGAPIDENRKNYIPGRGQYCHDCVGKYRGICLLCKRPAVGDEECLTPEGNHIACTLTTYSCLLCGRKTPLPHVCPVFYPEFPELLDRGTSLT